MAWTKQGNIKGATGSAGAQGTAGTTGATGSQGAQGASGATGAAGARGSQWTTGVGAPVSTTGIQTGDMYLDTSTGDVYQF